MEPTFEVCASCDARLYDNVKHCPYCGAGQLHAQPAASTDAPPAVLNAGAAAAVEPPPAASDTAAAVSAAPPAVAAVVKPQEPEKAPPPEAPKLPATPNVVDSAAGSRAVTPQRDAPPTSPPPSTPSDSTVGVLVVAVVLVFVVAAMVGVYLLVQPSEKDDACSQAMNRAASLLAGGDAAGARGQAMLAMPSCSGEARVKVGELQAAAEKAITAQANCERSFRRISSQIAERRLQSARTAHDQLDTACADSLQGKGLRTQIESGQGAANAAEAEMRRHLAEGDVKAARIALDLVATTNREHPDLMALRQELAAGTKVPDGLPTINAPSPTLPTLSPPREMPRETPREAPRDVRRDVQVEPMQPVRPQPPAALTLPPMTNVQADMAQSFLRDAESAMNQLKFDAAKTYVESARRLDPGNPQAAALARRIKERELQYLKEETSIK